MGVIWDVRDYSIEGNRFISFYDLCEFLVSFIDAVKTFFSLLFSPQKGSCDGISLLVRAALKNICLWRIIFAKGQLPPTLWVAAPYFVLFRGLDHAWDCRRSSKRTL